MTGMQKIWVTFAGASLFFGTASALAFQSSGSLTSLIINTGVKERVMTQTFVARPNGDGGILAWTPTPSGSHYTTINDIASAPTVPNTFNYIATAEQNARDFIHVSNPQNATGTEIGIKLWIYAQTGAKRQIRFSLVDGEGVGNNTFDLTTIGENSPQGWYASATTTIVCGDYWSDCQAGLNLLRFRFQQVRTSLDPGGTAFVYAAYAELEYNGLVPSESGVLPNSLTFLGWKPAGTRVKFQIASSNATSGPWSFVGWNSSAGNCDPSSFYTAVPGTPVEIKALCHENHRYLRYRLTLETSIGFLTPRVDDVLLNYAR